MAQLDFTTAEEVLQEDYQDDVRDFLNQNVFILSQTDVNTTRVTGRRALHAVHTSRSPGVGSVGENANLPAAGSQKYKNLQIPIRYSYGRIELSGPIISAMGDDAAAFVDGIDSEMEGIKNDMQRDRSRQSWGDANGVIAQCGVTSNSTTVVLAPTTTEAEIDQLFNDGGMVADVGTVGTPDTVAADREVEAVDYDALTAEISGASITTTASHFFFRANAGGASDGSGMPGDGQIEITGLGAIVSDDTDLHGLAYATNPTWQSVVDTAGSDRPISEQLINKLIHAVERKSGKQINLLVGSDGVSRSIANRLEAMRRNIDNVDLKAGYEGVSWTTPAEGMGKRTKVALVWDRDVKNGRLYGISLKGLIRYQMQDYEWMQRDGAIFDRVTGKDAWEATLTIYDELAAVARNCHFVAKNLTEAG